MEVLRTSDKKRAPTGWLEFGARAKHLREQRGITRDAVANSTSVDATSLWRIERGEQWVSPRALKELSSLYQVEVEEFFKRQNEAGTGSKISNNEPVQKPKESESIASIFRAVLAALSGMNEDQLRLVLRMIRGISGGQGQLQDLDDRVKRD